MHVQLSIGNKPKVSSDHQNRQKVSEIKIHQSKCMTLQWDWVGWGVIAFRCIVSITRLWVIMETPMWILGLRVGGSKRLKCHRYSHVVYEYINTGSEKLWYWYYILMIEFAPAVGAFAVRLCGLGVIKGWESVNSRKGNLDKFNKIYFVSYLVSSWVMYDPSHCL